MSTEKKDLAAYMQAEVARAQAQREKGQIHCCDEMGLRSDHQAGC